MSEIEQRLAAGRVAGQCELLDVRLLAATVATNNFPDPGQTLSYDLNASPTVQYQDGEEQMVVTIDYTLKVTQNSEEGKEELQIAELTFTYAALFGNNPDKTFDEDELKAFTYTTATFALYPYVREYVQDVTGRIGLPPLTLGLLKITPDEG